MTKNMNSEILKHLRLRAERLRREYQESRIAFQQSVKSQEAFMEIGAEVLKRSSWRLPKKTTRALGSTGLIGWRGSEKFKRFEREAEILVEETERILTPMKSRKPSLRMVHEAVMPDTKLKRLVGALVTAEQRSRISHKKSSPRSLRKRNGVRRGKITGRAEMERKRGASHIQTLVGVGATAVFGFAGLVWIFRLGLVESALVLAAGTGLALAIADALLIRFSRQQR